MNQTVPVVACIGLGGNLGDVPTAIVQAIDALARLPQTQVRRYSRLYRTPAWGLTAQPDFINAAVVLETTLAAPLLLEHLLVIERHAGRARDAALRWGPRTLDLDLLLYGQAVIAQDGLRVPHPHLHERAFVLVPLAEIMPDALVPGRGVVWDLLATVDAHAIIALDPV